jgi:hypothetical protein
VRNVNELKEIAELQKRIRELERQHARHAMEIHAEASKLGRGIISSPVKPIHGAVVATYPPGSWIANHDSWRCHHDHEDDDLEALQCALDEVRRLKLGGEYRYCSNGRECTVCEPWEIRVHYR